MKAKPSRKLQYMVTTCKVCGFNAWQETEQLAINKAIRRGKAAQDVMELVQGNQN